MMEGFGWDDPKDDNSQRAEDGPPVTTSAGMPDEKRMPPYPTAWREAVARAMVYAHWDFDNWDHIPDDVRAAYLSRADAAIRALLPLVVEHVLENPHRVALSNEFNLPRCSACGTSSPDHYSKTCDRPDCAWRALTKELSDGQ